jgi:hypothetical protein
VSFDLNSDGLKEQVSWTAATSSVAFLVLDRNYNGVIDNGRELFGNYTLQSGVTDRNGFAALAMYDNASFGGNGDGVITKDDAVYSRLQLWLDVNHNGISEPSELHSLAEYSIESLPLKYQDSRRVDEFGNLFRYRAKVEAREKTISRWLYDVFLRTPLSSVNSQIAATNPATQPMAVRRTANTTSEKLQMHLENTLDQAGIVVIDSTSPEFAAEIERLLVPEAVEKAKAFLPYSAVVVNRTNQYIWGFTLVYKYPNWISPSGTPWKHRINPSAAGPATRNQMLAPGSSFLITPVSSFLASRDSGGKRILQPLLDEGMDRTIQLFLAQNNKTDRIELSVDSVIFEDGTLIGPDREGAMVQINERIRAENDLYASIENLAGTPLRERLSSHIHNDKKGEYAQHIASRAEAIADLVDAQGEKVAIDLVQSMKNKKWFSSNAVVRRRTQ